MRVESLWAVGGTLLALVSIAGAEDLLQTLFAAGLIVPVIGFFSKCCQNHYLLNNCVNLREYERVHVNCKHTQY